MLDSILMWVVNQHFNYIVKKIKNIKKNKHQNITNVNITYPINILTC